MSAASPEGCRISRVGTPDLRPDRFGVVSSRPSTPQVARVTRTEGSYPAPPTSVSMRISVPTETAPREQRVALAPDSVGRLVKQLKREVVVQRGAGHRAGFRDEMYESAGATLAPDAASAF